MILFKSIVEHAAQAGFSGDDIMIALTEMRRRIGHLGAVESSTSSTNVVIKIETKETVCTKAKQALVAVLQRADAVCYATFTTRLCTITGSHFEREVQGQRAVAPLPPRRWCGSTSGAEKSGSGRSFAQDRKVLAHLDGHPTDGIGSLRPLTNGSAAFLALDPTSGSRPIHEQYCG